MKGSYCQLDDPISGEDASGTEDDDQQEAVSKPGASLPTKRVLRSHLSTTKAHSQEERRKGRGRELLRTNYEVDHFVSPTESTLRSVLDDFCEESATNTKLIDALMHKFDCQKDNLMDEVGSIQTSQCVLDRENQKLAAEKKQLERKLKDSIQSTMLPMIQTSIETLVKAADKVSLSSVERLQLAALTSEGWKNDEKNLSKIAIAITNQKGLLDKKHEAFAKLVGELQKMMEQHVKSIPLQIDHDITDQLLNQETENSKIGRGDSGKEAIGLKQFIQRVMEFVEPSVDFLRYYRFKKICLCYHYGIPEFEKCRGVALYQIYQVWIRATAEDREFIAFALLYGDLKVEDLSLANRLLGNLPGWALQFQCTYLEGLDIHLSSLAIGDIEIDTSSPSEFIPISSTVNFNSLVQKRKSLILLESKVILDTLKSRLEMFQGQSFPTVFDRIQQIGGESGFSLEKLERGVIAAARVQKLFDQGQDFMLGDEFRQYACPTPMLDREYTFVANMVEQKQLFNPLLVTPEYSPPRLDEDLKCVASDTGMTYLIQSPLQQPLDSDQHQETSSDDSPEALGEDDTDLIQVETIEDSPEPVTGPSYQKRKKLKSHPPGFGQKYLPSKKKIRRPLPVLSKSKT